MRAGAATQGLSQNDQVLALARVAESRSDAGDFTPKAIDVLFHELRLPGPSKTGNNLVALERVGLVRRGTSKGLWHVTPTGKATPEKIVSGMDLAALQAEAAISGARLGGAAHPVILPELGAPPELVPILRDFLAQHEFSRNVFGMTRFPKEGSDAPPDPIKDALEVARDVCASHSLELHLASDGHLHDDLWTNVAAYMWASRYGIAFVEDLAVPPRGLNYNLTAEVGSMLITGRRCCLLKDPSIESLPTDFVGRIRKDVDLSNTKQVEKALHTWIRDDLRLGSCPSCRSS